MRAASAGARGGRMSAPDAARQVHQRSCGPAVPVAGRQTRGRALSRGRKRGAQPPLARAGGDKARCMQPGPSTNAPAARLWRRRLGGDARRLSAAALQGSYALCAARPGACTEACTEAMSAADSRRPHNRLVCECLASAEGAPTRSGARGGGAWQCSAAAPALERRTGALCPRSAAVLQDETVC
eukprot:CAMPEP_0170136878 /NCGR_PEP_ID=MMETSP0033_2-20121228/3712_1 /TAXON_ID=195969 /ORGANISM="Dolichomastix tenuilepis, Strain CCMP3274" /LENGTH=183 /DNA_ID=CAMNT_0010372681 /DNA_START=631 /DNA_END=1183 /DNA_ORIENTATION=-